MHRFNEFRPFSEPIFDAFTYARIVMSMPLKLFNRFVLVLQQFQEYMIVMDHQCMIVAIIVSVDEIQ